MSKYNIDESRQIAIIWDISDVQMERPDLDDEEAMKVLLYAEDKHDVSYGITWDFMCECAHDLFPLLDVSVLEQDKNNCALCKFNASISENKCRKYDPYINAIDEEGDEVYCSNFEEGTFTETQKRAFECAKCQKNKDDCSGYEADADDECNNSIPRNFNLCKDCRFTIDKINPCNKYYKGSDGNCRNYEAYLVRIFIKE